MEISPSHVHTTFTPDVLQMLGSVRDPRMKRKLESDPRFLQVSFSFLYNYLFIFISDYSSY